MLKSGPQPPPPAARRPPPAAAAERRAAATAGLPTFSLLCTNLHVLACQNKLTIDPGPSKAAPALAQTSLVQVCTCRPPATPPRTCRP